MNIIQKQPNEGGTYPPIQSWSGEMPPEGYYEVAEGVALSCGGFGKFTFTGTTRLVVTGFVPDEAAWGAWQVEHQPPATEPTAESAKSEAVAAMLKATTIKTVAAAFTKYAAADGIIITQG